MSATLPPIPVGGHVTQKVLQTLQPINPSQYGNKQKGKHRSAPTNRSTPKPSEIIDTARFRNTFFHNLCLDMLQDGHHQAFKELFNLVQMERTMSTEKVLASNATPIYLEDEIDKLEFMKNQLITAEQARRTSRSEKVYQAYLTLARHFQDINDDWLSDTFYQRSFECSQSIRGDGRCKEAEANWNLGLARERQMNLEKAQEYFEKFHKLSKGKEWKGESGSLFSQASCFCLQRVYVKISEQLATEDKASLDYLHKAYDMTKEANDPKESGNVGYLLGSKYDQGGDTEKAVMYYNEYLEACKQANDDLGVGKACQALAVAHQRTGNMDEAVENLKMFLRVSERAGDAEAKQSACSDLGALFNNMGKYEQASKYFSRAFETSKERNSLDEVDNARCEYAMSLSHGLFTGCVDAFIKNNRFRIDSLCLWKSERVQGFTEDTATYNMYESLQDRTNKVRDKQEQQHKQRRENYSREEKTETVEETVEEAEVNEEQ